VRGWCCCLSHGTLHKLHGATTISHEAWKPDPGNKFLGRKQLQCDKNFVTTHERNSNTATTV